MLLCLIQFSSVQSLSHVQLFATLWTVACQASLPFPVPELAQTHVHRVLVMPSNISSFHPLLLLPSVLLSIRVFSNELALAIRWPKYWSFSVSIWSF